MSTPMAGGGERDSVPRPAKVAGALPSVVELHGRVCGRLWNTAARPTDSSGAILQIQHSRHGQTPLGSQLLRFTHVTFNEKGDACAACDQLGNLFIFNLEDATFTLAHRVELPCTAICFHNDTLLIGVADNSFRSYHRENDMHRSALEHRTCIHHISAHPTSPIALTTSADETILWNLDDHTIERTLHGAGDVGIQLAKFSHLGDLVLTCFKNDEIFAWHTVGLRVAFKLMPPRERHSPLPHYRTFSVTRDGRTLVAAGRSQFLAVYRLADAALHRTVKLPGSTQGVRQVEFLWRGQSPDRQVVAVLCDTGRVEIIDIDAATLLCSVGIGGAWSFIDATAACLHGRYLSAVHANGSLKIHNVDAVLTVPSAPPLRPSARAAPAIASSTTRPAWASTLRQNEQIVQPNNASVRKVKPKGSAARWKSHIQQAFSDIREDKLHDLLMGHGEYPAKYRKYIWRQLLQLPENADVYQNLLSKGTHSAFATFHQLFPMKSRKLLRISQRNLSALAHWAPIMGEVKYLPHLAFPFIKFFENTPFASFEAVMTIIVNWCQQWFEFFPNPPVNVLNMVENVLVHHEPQLHRHLLRCGVTSQVFAWPLMQTLLSDVFEEEEWLAVWDNILSNHPGYLLHVVAAYVAVNKASLLKVTQMHDFQFFFNRFNPIGVRQVIKKARQFVRSTPREINPVYLLGHFAPLQPGSYPIFNNYPAFIVDFQVQERERIRQEELDFLRERAAAVESRKQIDRLKQEEHAWTRQQELLLAAESERRGGIENEEKRLAEQRRRFEAMRRDQLVEELQAYEESRHTFAETEKSLRMAELSRVDDHAKGTAVQARANAIPTANDRMSQLAHAAIPHSANPEPTPVESLSRIELLTSDFNDEKVQSRRRWEQQESDALHRTWQLREKLANATPTRPSRAQ
eukprot:m.97506 g.97506  ORF g.97506 m.97506 type:complete len:915 (+) comp20535_c0_seq3:232-2976(+)